jgi:putative endonuclease
MHNSGIGREGEKRAAELLEKAGMSIIARNIRSRRGEVDLVALDGEVIVFIEVKTWSVCGLEDLEYGIDKKKQGRIIETAKYFLSSHREYNDMIVRFDVVFIGPEAVTHLTSAFTEHV